MQQLTLIAYVFPDVGGLFLFNIKVEIVTFRVALILVYFRYLT